MANIRDNSINSGQEGMAVLDGFSKPAAANAPAPPSQEISAPSAPGAPALLSAEIGNGTLNETEIRAARSEARGILIEQGHGKLQDTDSQNHRYAKIEQTNGYKSALLTKRYVEAIVGSDDPRGVAMGKIDNLAVNKDESDPSKTNSPKRVDHIAKGVENEIQSPTAQRQWAEEKAPMSVQDQAKAAVAGMKHLGDMKGVSVDTHGGPAATAVIGGNSKDRTI